MRRAIGIGLLVLLATPVFAADIAKAPGVTIEGQYTPGTPEFRWGSVLVVSIVEGVFTDLGPAYQAALATAGASLVDLAYDPNLGSGWPNLANYDMVLVTTSDNWWMTLHAGASEQTMLSFMGCLVVIGQDYVYGTGLSDGFKNRFAITSIVQDVNFGDASLMTLTGVASGPFSGLSDTGFPCFLANPWFTDDVEWNPSQGYPTQDWAGGSFSGHGGSADHYEGIFSSNEYACMDGFQNWVDRIADYCGLGGATPTEQSTWGRIKAAHR